MWSGLSLKRTRRYRFSGTLQCLQNRVTEFEERAKALTSWQVLNSRLRSTDALCAKVGETEPCPETSFKSTRY